MGENIEASYALEYARKLGASYSDLRVSRRRAEKIELVDGTSIPSGPHTAGLGLRVLVNGAWGFTSRPLDGNLGRAVLREVVGEAVELAKASAPRRNRKVRLAQLRGFVPGTLDCRTRTATPYHALSIKERMKILTEWDATLRGQFIASRMVSIETEVKDDFLAQMEGRQYREIYQNRYGCEIFLSVTAIGHGEVQTRSRLFAGTTGYPFPLTEQVTVTGRQLRREAVKLLRAPECREEVCDVIIMPDQFTLHTHETVHGMEGDRTEPLDFEATYMGGAVMSDPRMLYNNGGFRLASKHVTLLADSTLRGGYGTYDFDDDGIASSRFPLLQQGVFANFLLSREVAGELCRATGDSSFLSSPALGCNRASDYSRMPLVRMTNTVLVPGEATFAELVSGIDYGLVIATPYSWSMYPSRHGFIFGCQIGWRISKGKIQGLVRNPAYHGATVPFWQSIAAVGCEFEIHNQPNCGKGHPGQAIGTGHGSPEVAANGVSVFSRRHFRGGKKGGSKCC